MNRSPSDDSALYRAKRPRSPLAGPYGHPLHATVITIPIGAWTASLVFDIVALATDDGSFAQGALWLIGIGLVGAVLAAALGLIDLSGIAPGTKARKTGLAHMVLNLAATALFLVSLLLRVGDPDEPNVAGFVISIVAFLIVGASGFLGGELAYRFGVRVADEGTQAEAFESAPGARSS